MLGLVQYDSDEDREEEAAEKPERMDTGAGEENAVLPEEPPVINIIKADSKSSSDRLQSTEAPSSSIQRKVIASGDDGKDTSDTLPTDEDDTFGPQKHPTDTADSPTSEVPSDLPSAPQSPYSYNRSLLRSYTIPQIPPDFTIPDSPSTSPDRATSAQFANFAKLKKKDVHFNQKLAQTPALRNPNMLENLMKHVGLDKVEGQYASNWVKDIWNPDPTVLGKGVDARRGEKIVDALARLQTERTAKLQAERATVGFVGAQNSGGVAEKTVAAPAQAPMSAAERIMAGLDRDSRKSTPEVQSKKENYSSSSSRRRDDDRDRDRNRDRDRDRDRNRYRDDYDRHKRPRSRSRDRSRERARYRERERDYSRR